MTYDPAAPDPAAICGNKSRFDSAGLAYDYARQYRRQFHCLQRPYRCKACGGWHLSTKPLPKKQRRYQRRSLTVTVFYVSVNMDGVKFADEVKAKDLPNAEQEVYWMIADRMDDAGRPLRGTQRSYVRELIGNRDGVVIRPLTQAEIMRRAGHPTLFGNEVGR